MGIRLQGGFTSAREESVYVINIHDTDFSGSATDFDIMKDGLTLSYDHKEKGRNISILTSKLRIRMKFASSGFLDFLDDVVNSAEGRFRVEVTKDGNKWWYGYILPDLLDREDLPYGVNPVLTINATDGIGRLKEIDYNNAGSAYTGKTTFLDHLYNILDKIGFDDFYTTDDYLVTYVDWWDTNHTYSASTNPWELTRFDHKALIEVDRGGETIYNNAYDVLEQIVKAWNCRFMYSEGAYYLIQINAYETDGSTKVLKVYDKDKNLSTTSTTDFDTWTKRTGNLDLYQDGTYEAYQNNGRFRYYPALREVKVTYEHFSTDSFINGVTWTEDTSPVANFSSVDFNGGNARLIFSADLEVRANFQASPGFQVSIFLFRVQVKVGSYYLKRTVTITNGNPSYGGFTWSLSPNFVEVFGPWIHINNEPAYGQVNFVTPLLLGEGDLQVSVSLYKMYNYTGAEIIAEFEEDNFTPYYTFENTSVNIFVDGNLEGQTNFEQFTASNDDGSTNSKIEEVALLVGDGPSLNTLGALSVYDSFSWVEATDWRKGNSGSYVAFGQLLANELMAGQIFGTERYIGDVTGDYLPHGRLRRIFGSTAVNYIFIGGSFNVHQDIWSGEWIQVDVDNLRVTASGGRNFTASPGKPRRFAGGGSGRNVGLPGRTAIRPSDLISDIPLIIPDGLPEQTAAIQVVLGLLFPNTDDDIDEGDTVTQIPIPDRTVDGEYKAGQVVTLTNQFTGAQQSFTVTADTSTSDTYISVSSTSANFDFPAGSYIVTSQEEQQSLSGSGNSYRQEFTSHASATITVTTADLPSNEAAIRVYYDNGQIISPSYWSHSGNVITLTFTPPGSQSIWVEFSK